MPDRVCELHCGTIACVSHPMNASRLGSVVGVQGVRGVEGVLGRWGVVGRGEGGEQREGGEGRADARRVVVTCGGGGEDASFARGSSFGGIDPAVCWLSAGARATPYACRAAATSRSPYGQGDTRSLRLAGARRTRTLVGHWLFAEGVVR